MKWTEEEDKLAEEFREYMWLDQYLGDRAQELFGEPQKRSPKDDENSNVQYKCFLCSWAEKDFPPTWTFMVAHFVKNHPDFVSMAALAGE